MVVRREPFDLRSVDMSATVCVMSYGLGTNVPTCFGAAFPDLKITGRSGIYPKVFEPVAVRRANRASGYLTIQDLLAGQIQ